MPAHIARNLSINELLSTCMFGEYPFKGHFYGSYSLNNNKTGRKIIIFFTAFIQFDIISHSKALFYSYSILSVLILLFKLEFIWVWSLIAVRSVGKHLVGMSMKAFKINLISILFKSFLMLCFHSSQENVIEATLSHTFR